MKNLSCLAVATLGVAALAGSAQASNYVFTYTDANTSASGTLSATDNGNGSYTAIAGLINVTSGGLPVGSFPLWANPNAPNAIVSPSGQFSIDNQLFPADGPGGYLDVSGLLFTDGTTEINIWGNGQNNPYSGWSAAGGNYTYASNEGSFTLTLVPVPAASLTGLAGLAGLGVFGRRRVRA